MYVAAEGGHSIAYCICNCGHYYCSMCYRNYHYPLTCKQVRTSPSLWMFYSMKRGLLTRMKRWTLCSTYTRISNPVPSARFHCSKTLYYQLYVHLAIGLQSHEMSKMPLWVLLDVCWSLVIIINRCMEEWKTHGSSEEKGYYRCHKVYVMTQSGLYD